MDRVNCVLSNPHQPGVPVPARAKICGYELEDLLVDLLLTVAGDEQPCRIGCQVRTIAWSREAKMSAESRQGQVGGNSPALISSHA